MLFWILFRKAVFGAGRLAPGFCEFHFVLFPSRSPYVDFYIVFSRRVAHRSRQAGSASSGLNAPAPLLARGWAVARRNAGVGRGTGVRGLKIARGPNCKARVSGRGSAARPFRGGAREATREKYRHCRFVRFSWAGQRLELSHIWKLIPRSALRSSPRCEAGRYAWPSGFQISRRSC